MKFNTGLIVLIIGIIALLITIIVKDYSYYFSGFAILIILVGIWAMFSDSTKRKKKFNYREINDGNNCLKCEYNDTKLFNGYESVCKLLKIKIDKNHVCDFFNSQDKI
jgi:hypothetical protein